MSPIFTSKKDNSMSDLIEYIRQDGTKLQVAPSSVSAAEKLGWKTSEQMKAAKKPKAVPKKGTK
jgi:hypothetical protein|tara:strand:+ start:3430 stop:3621 length:192 start_codon:yes stop_codon:yes gene_type:complete